VSGVKRGGDRVEIAWLRVAWRVGVSNYVASAVITIRITVISIIHGLCSPEVILNESNNFK
jgi:hypothetical protein